jgi:diguanylate cyclase
MERSGSTTAWGATLNINGLVTAITRSVAQRIAPPIPDAIRTALQQAQYEDVRQQVPMLLFVAALNTVIIMAVCAHDGLSFEIYGWMSLIILYCLIRLIFWARIFRRPVEPAKIPRLLRMNVAASLVMITVLGLDAAITFLTGMFSAQWLIPVSLSFGTMAIAHCLYSLRPAAIGVIIMGLFPSSLAMVAAGDFAAKMLGLSTLSVGFLMIRFVSAQYDQLVKGLLLQHANRQMALTDPLTGIANRRAMMDALDAETMAGDAFGVALLDLDGFKEVNDSLGHYAGDAMLQAVGERLVAAALPSDSVGRLGGDEFIIVFRGIAGERDLSARATAMISALCLPVEIDGHVLPVAASLGYAISAGEGVSADLLLRQADKALYSAKRQRKAPANAPTSPARPTRRAGSA